MKNNTKSQKKKLKIFNPKLKEECGVFGISSIADASTLTALGLHALQHRGQEGCGIVSYDGKNYHSEKRQGLVGDHFTDPKTLKNMTKDTTSLIKSQSELMGMIQQMQPVIQKGLSLVDKFHGEGKTEKLFKQYDNLKKLQKSIKV